MRLRTITICISIFGLLLFTMPLMATDYENWTSALPESIESFEQTDSRKGANMESGGESWSVLRQEYSNDAGEELQLNIVSGSDAPQIRQFENMQAFNLETENRIAKTLEIEGYKSFLDFKKRGGPSTVMISVESNSLVILETRAAESQAELKSLANAVPLEDISAELQ